MQYHLALYDWNQTLLNDGPISYNSIRSVFGKFAPEAPVPSFETVRREINNSDWAAFFYQHGVSRSVTIHEMLDCWFGHYRFLADSSAFALNDGALELLSFCTERNIPNAIVTASRDGIQSYLERFGIHGFFAAVTLNQLNGWTKEVGIRDLLQRFGVSPRNAFYIDDTFDGITHAKAARVMTIGFLGGLHLEERIAMANPDYVVQSLGQVPTIIAG